MSSDTNVRRCTEVGGRARKLASGYLPQGDRTTSRCPERSVTPPFPSAVWPALNVHRRIPALYPAIDLQCFTAASKLRVRPCSLALDGYECVCLRGAQAQDHECGFRLSPKALKGDTVLSV
ncbi:hypothetical protein SKAU_G00180900 [Synaphobranchus kaupii]|uniref:Uncharacterized protein n=1 Tax=Synaphobranchus kaupii TaxID=118154 RepID=A0A9Q1FMU7_SYNKA|nr:hypothetical protein SKAU_G00180900 [Synaphobranchus kaupii]